MSGFGLWAEVAHLLAPARGSLHNPNYRTPARDIDPLGTQRTQAVDNRTVQRHIENQVISGPLVAKSSWL